MAQTNVYNGLDTRVGSTANSVANTYLRDGAYVTDAVLKDSTATFTPGVSERRGTTTTFSHSGLKNADAQSNVSQAVNATQQYDAFGNLASSTGNWQGQFGYGGGFGYQQDATGLKLLGHRYYDASTGRFLTRDPIKDGRNWYVYCDGDPINRFDGDGALWREVGSIAGGVVGTIVGGPIGSAIGAGLGGFIGSLADGNSLGDAAVDGAVDASLGLVGGAVGKLLPAVKVIPAGAVDDVASGGRIIIGETMDRVRLIAGRIGAETFELDPWPGMWPAMWKNFKWLIGHIFAKDDIVDAGIDLDRTTGRSPFYKMEHIVTNLFEAR